MKNKLEIIKPDDWHLHLRDGDLLNAVIRHSARSFRRAVIMPNLTPPVTTAAEALEYRERILKSLQGSTEFSPLMTLYLTDSTSPKEIAEAKATGLIPAAKLYPANATTNSQHGITHHENILPVLEEMQKQKMLLLIHGEVTNTEADIFDREQLFIDSVLTDIVTRFPDLKIVVEHLTTSQGVEFVKNASDNVAATITAHHLLYDRNAIFKGGLQPHYYCLPVLKRKSHQEALIAAATSGNPKFFLGTDSAPHLKGAKETACGCAGCFTAPAALELYTEAFDKAGALDKLEGFASIHGPQFYDLPVNKEKITLVREEWTLPESFQIGEDSIVPLRGGQQLTWKIAD